MTDAVTKAVEAAAFAISKRAIGYRKWGDKDATGRPLPEEMRGLETVVVSPKDAAIAAIAAFLDAVKDAPTEEMLTAGYAHACDHWVGEDAPKMWRDMCLALRRGVAGD